MEFTAYPSFPVLLKPSSSLIFIIEPENFVLATNSSIFASFPRNSATLSQVSSSDFRLSISNSNSSNQIQILNFESFFTPDIILEVNSFHQTNQHPISTFKPLQTDQHSLTYPITFNNLPTQLTIENSHLKFQNLEFPFTKLEVHLLSQIYSIQLNDVTIEFQKEKLLLKNVFDLLDSRILYHRQIQQQIKENKRGLTFKLKNGYKPGYKPTLNNQLECSLQRQTFQLSANTEESEYLFTQKEFQLLQLPFSLQQKLQKNELVDFSEFKQEFAQIVAFCDFLGKKNCRQTVDEYLRRGKVVQQNSELKFDPDWLRELVEEMEAKGEDEEVCKELRKVL